MIVLKLGGSLYSNPLLKEWVNNLASIDNQTIVIVPGGGPFADQVRKASGDWVIDDDSAHEMAVLAMQQYACLINHIDNRIVRLTSIEYFKDNNQTYIWHPYHDVTAKCDYPKNWQTTSDSISLWLAKILSAKQLVLIKSAHVEGMQIQEVIKAGIVDDYFLHARKIYEGDILFYHASQLKDFLKHYNYE